MIPVLMAAGAGLMVLGAILNPGKKSKEPTATPPTAEPTLPVKTTVTPPASDPPAT